jgi:hypothetical protein
MKRHQKTARGTTSPFQVASAILFILSKSSGRQINPHTGLIPAFTGQKHSGRLENGSTTKETCQSVEMEQHGEKFQVGRGKNPNKLNWHPS